MMDACQKAAGRRFPNFIVVEFYQRSDGEGALEAHSVLQGGNADEHEGSSNLMCPDDHMNFCSGLAHNLIADK
ncbi:hypothetical protein ACET3Z_032314 [Daucus carota]